jgi:hypothetical protein
MTYLIDVDEIIAKGDELIEQAVKSPVSVIPDALRVWYDETLASRIARHNQITTPGGVMVVGQTVDVTYTQHQYGGRPTKLVTLRGWVVEGRGGYGDSYVRVRKPKSAGSPYGTDRQLTIKDITQVEVIA